MKSITPHNLKAGDTIGIIVPSRHIFDDVKPIQQGIALLKKQGFTLKFASNYKKKLYSAAGTPKERARAVNNMFADTDVKTILCALGGDTANQIIELLDYQTIKANPKIIVGYSDNTHFLLAIHAQTGLEVFHGPNVAQLSRITKASQKQFFDTLTKPKQTQNIFSECKVLKPGKASGDLIGGNLLVINALSKTKYMPNLKNAILFWEEINDGTSAVGYQLQQLHNTGILKQIKGMIIGHIVEPKKDESEPWKNTLLKLAKQYSYPILKTDCFGHFTKEFYTFPIGGKTIIDTAKKQCVFES